MNLVFVKEFSQFPPNLRPEPPNALKLAPELRYTYGSSFVDCRTFPPLC